MEQNPTIGKDKHMDKYLFETVITKKDAAFLPDGYWEVTFTLTQKRSLNGLDWEEKEVKVSDISKNRNEAELGTTRGMFEVLASYDYNLFSNPEDLKYNDEDEIEFLL